MPNKNLFLIVLLALVSLTSKAQNPNQIWATDTVFSGPESVVYDPERALLYVSNMKRKGVNDLYYNNDYVSKVNMAGEIVELEWITGLTEPTGITIFSDHLYIVERYGVVIYDLKADKIDRRIKIKYTGFLNDITISPEGILYVSESSTNKIYTIKNDTATVWIQSSDISQPNGILYDEEKILVASNTDSTIKAIDIKTKKIQHVAQLKKGIIDGVKKIGEDYLVSLLEGNVYRVTLNGQVTEILNTRLLDITIADFEYIESQKMLIAPSIWQNNLVAFRLE